MCIWNRQHGQCNFLLKWFVRMHIRECWHVTGILTVTMHCDTACYQATPGKCPAPVTSIMACPLSCVTGRFVCVSGGG